MIDWKAIEKQADGYLGIIKGNLLKVEDMNNSDTYQARFKETKPLYNALPYSEPETELFLQLKQDIQDRIVEVAKDVATPTQLLYLKEFLQLNQVVSVAKKLSVSETTIRASIFGPGLINKITKALLKDEIYINLKNKLKDIK